MNPERWQEIKAALDCALQLTGAERRAYVDEITRNDPQLRLELESLIAAHEGSSGSFMNLPAAAFEPVVETLSARVGARIGNYRLVCEIGHGGMGQVWLAEQVAPVHRLVALKLIRAGMYDETVAHRFEGERQSLAIMDHPAIAKVFDAGSTPQGQPYFVMEYVPGTPITEYCDEKRFKIRDRLELFIQACDGVQHAHQKAIIHRDLKPANILIVEVDGRAVPRIIDFGLAKAVTPVPDEETLYTQYGQFIGTPGYMSPEQVDPTIHDIDTRTDVYSLGVILYVLLTGLQPFETRRKRPPLDEWLRRLREEEPPTLGAKLSEDRDSVVASAAARATEPKQLKKLLRGDLEWITMKALERRRERRYGTPSELAADLRRHLHDEPVEARPGSTVYQIRKFVLRHRVAAAVAAMAAFLGITASVAGLIAIQEKKAAQYQALQALQAQSRLLTQAAAQRLKDSDAAGAQGIILEVLTNPGLARARPLAAVSVFQEIRSAEAQSAIFVGHRDFVWSATYSPDGTRIVSASADNTARIWDAATGTLLRVLSGHTSAVSYAAYSPDGTRIVTASGDNTARIWDARAGTLLAVLRGHEKGVYSAAYSPDGSHIVTASGDKTARIWDARSGSAVLLLSGHEGLVFSAAYSPDGTRIATASGDKTARIWDARSGSIVQVLSGHTDGVYGAAYSPDGAHLVSSSRDGTARIWDAHTGALASVLLGHRAVVYSAAYSPDGLRIITASGDKTARLWDATSGEALITFVGHSNGVFSANFSPNGMQVVTASTDRTVRTWDASMGRPILVLAGHGDRVESASYSPDGSRIATASKDRTARIWNALTGAPLAMLIGHDNVVESVAYSPDGTRIVTGAYGSTARIWDSITGAPVAVLTGHDSAVNAAGYSPDGTRIVTGSQDKTARIWNAVTGTTIAVLKGHEGAIYSAGYSPDGAHIVTASRDGTARVWDAATGASTAVLRGHSAAVTHAAFSPDGTHIVTASADKTARIWDATTGEGLGVLTGHNGDLSFAEYSPDGTRVVTAAADKTARIWDVRSGTPLAVLFGHRDEVYSAVYSPDGMRIVTASADRSARVWDARIPADIDAQVIWSLSAQFDPLSDPERAQLGLPPDPRIRMWSGAGSACDQAAAAIYDPDRRAPGVEQAAISADVASSACASEIAKQGNSARLSYEYGRALLGRHDPQGARRQFELAISQGYAAAGIDLAGLLLDGSAGMRDPAGAESLYEQAWRNGVPISAFELGQLYEIGAHATDASEKAAFPQDLPQAWLWYARGAAVGEPNALGRFADSIEAKAVAESSTPARNLRLLRAFGYFAAAAGRAQTEGWPDDAWRGWRYQRATLSRLLARAGMMQAVADEFEAEREKWKPQSPTLPQRIASRLHW